MHAASCTLVVPMLARAFPTDRPALIGAVLDAQDCVRNDLSDDVPEPWCVGVSECRAVSGRRRGNVEGSGCRLTLVSECRAASSGVGAGVGLVSGGVSQGSLTDEIGW